MERVVVAALRDASLLRVVHGASVSVKIERASEVCGHRIVRNRLVEIHFGRAAKSGASGVMYCMCRKKF